MFEAGIFVFSQLAEKSNIIGPLSIKSTKTVREIIFFDTRKFCLEMVSKIMNYFFKISRFYVLKSGSYHGAKGTFTF